MTTCFAVLSGGALMPPVLPAPPADPSRIIMNIPATMARSLFLFLFFLSLSLTVRQHLFYPSQYGPVRGFLRATTIATLL